MTEKKKTVGEEAYERLLKPDTKQGIIDTQREMDKEYMDQLQLCIMNAKKQDMGDEYFICVLAKKERLMENVIRRYFVPRKSLPTPDYDQTVWMHKRRDVLEFIWVIPDHNTCQEMYHHPERVPENEMWLYQMVKAFMEGRIYHEACKEFKIKPEFDEPKNSNLIV